jgi:hypothetical protein
MRKRTLHNGVQRTIEQMSLSSEWLRDAWPGFNLRQEHIVLVFRHHIQTGSGAHPMGTLGYFLGGNTDGAWS